MTSQRGESQQVAQTTNTAPVVLRPFKRASAIEPTHPVVLAAKQHDRKMALLAEKYWDPNCLSKDEMDHAEALGIYGELSYLPEHMRQGVQQLKATFHERERALVQNGVLESSDKLTEWQKAREDFRNGLAALLGDSLPEYNRRESDEAFSLRSLQREGLGLTREQFDAVLAIELQANGAMNEPDADIAAILERKQQQLMTDKNLGPAIAERVDMVSDSIYQTLNRIGNIIGLTEEHIRDLWQNFREYDRQLQPIFADAETPEEGRDANLRNLQQVQLQKLLQTIPADLLIRFARSPDLPIPYLAGLSPSP
jgi:hypothetical protein